VPDSVSASVSNVVTQNLNPGTNAQSSQNAFGAAPGISGDIQIFSGNRVTILASNRDVSGNKQTSGFYGVGSPAGQTAADVYTKFCAARPWTVNFLSSIIPASYFDNLCTSHGYSIVTPQLAVPTPPAAPPPPPPPSPAPQYLGPLTAAVWASPTSVSSGSKTNIFWSSTGAQSCAITSSDNAFNQTTLAGHASSQVLTKNTTFSIACQSATSTVSNQAVVTVQ
jgi:hypothetical protein